MIDTNKAIQLLVKEYKSPNIRLEKENGITFFFEYDTQKNPKRLRLPDGSIELSFLLEDGSIYLSGPFDCVQYVTYPKVGTVFGIRFFSGLVPDLWDKKFKLSDLTNRTMTFSVKDYPALAPIFKESYFSSRVETAKSILSMSTYFNGNKILNDLFHQIYINEGNVHLTNLCHDLKFSRQYVNQLAREKTGFAPKYFCKVLRFQYLIYCISKYYPEKRLYVIAKECGYYDLPHVNKDFREFTGQNPDLFIKQHTDLFRVE